MCGSPGDVREEPVTQKRKKGRRMNCDAGEATFPSLHLCYSSFANPFVALPTSQLILQPFRCFTYVTAQSPTLLSLLLRHRLFTYVTWRAAHVTRCLIRATWRSKVSGLQFIFAFMLLYLTHSLALRSFQSQDLPNYRSPQLPILGLSSPAPYSEFPDILLRCLYPSLSWSSHTPLYIFFNNVSSSRHALTISIWNFLFHLLSEVYHISHKFLFCFLLSTLHSQKRPQILRKIFLKKGGLLGAQNKKV